MPMRSYLKWMINCLIYDSFQFDTFADKLSKISVSIWADFRGDLSRGTLGTDDNTPNLLKVSLTLASLIFNSDDWRLDEPFQM